MKKKTINSPDAVVWLLVKRFYGGPVGGYTGALGRQGWHGLPVAGNRPLQRPVRARWDGVADWPRQLLGLWEWGGGVVTGAWPRHQS